MSRSLIANFISLLALFCAAPALAVSHNAISVPEPADAVLLLMGVAGVAIGRHMHARAARRGSADVKSDDSLSGQED